MSRIVISLFNNKGGVGKTTIAWNLGISLSAQGKRVLMIDFDPQCNLSIAVLGSLQFSNCLNVSNLHPFGQTIRAFAQPYIQQNAINQPYITQPKHSINNTLIDVVPGDFWLNNFADILNVGTDVIGGSGLYRFLLLHRLVEEIEAKYEREYDYVLIDLPPSFNTLVRAALYYSDYFLVPCTPDLFSAYCVGLIGEMLPLFITDWEQGKQRYLASNPFDQIIPLKGKPKFGGWIFNGFDTRNKKETGADKAQFESIKKAIMNNLISNLRNVSAFQCVPGFITDVPVAKIEDLNVMAPDSIVQNIPIKYLQSAKPTRDIGRGTWGPSQVDLMRRMDQEFDGLAQYVISHF